jgi:hypothetical protein
VPEEDTVWRAAPAVGRGLQDPGEAEGVPGDRGSPDAGPRTHVDLDPAEVLGGAGHRVHEGKSAIHVGRTFFDQKRNFVGQHLWARGYFVSTVGRDEATIREYIRNQEAEDKRLEQLRLP